MLYFSFHYYIKNVLFYSEKYYTLLKSFILEFYFYIY